jgi:hypothetical protein
VHLDAVQNRLYRAGLSFNLKKCPFCRSEVSYLVHVIGPGTLEVAEKTLWRCELRNSRIHRLSYVPFYVCVMSTEDFRSALQRSQRSWTLCYEKVNLLD